MVLLTEVLKQRRKTNFLAFVQNRKKVRNVLIIRNGLIGDVVSVTSVFSRILNTFPYASIDTITGPKAVLVFSGFPRVKRVIPFRYNYSLISVLKQMWLFLGLRKNRYDIVIVQETNTHFTFMAKLIGGRFTVGLDNALSSFYDYSVPRPSGKIAVAESATVREWTNKQAYEVTCIKLSLYEKVGIRQKLIALGITDPDNIVIIHAGSSKPDSDRQWVPMRFAETADYIAEKYNSSIVFTGVEHDREPVEAIQHYMKHQSYCLIGQTGVRELMALCGVAKLVLAPDTGIIHIATALNTPVIMLMGVSDPEDTGPYNPRGPAIVVRTGPPCSPCINAWPKPAQWEICKNLRPVKCMEEITTGMVIDAVDQILTDNKAFHELHDTTEIGTDVCFAEPPGNALV